MYDAIRGTVWIDLWSPESFINQTSPIWRYNELDFKRFQDGKRQQPDYIIFFKKGNNQINKECRQASKDFGDLPIVVVDIDKCLEQEKKKVIELQRTYDETGDIDYLKQIYQKIKNNRNTTSIWNRKEPFCQEIDLEELEQEIERQERTKRKNVTENDLVKNDGMVRELDRNDVVQSIKNLLEKIKASEQKNNQPTEQNK